MIISPTFRSRNQVTVNGIFVVLCYLCEVPLRCKIEGSVLTGYYDTFSTLPSNTLGNLLHTTLQSKRSS